MRSIIIWFGIATTVVGWIALAWQASKRMAVQKELEKFPERKKAMLLHRTYCRLVILIGIAFLSLGLIF